MNTVKVNFTGLKTLQRQVEELAQTKVQVGLFSDTSGRVAKKGRIDNNPSLGYVHEFGLTYSVISTGQTIHIPERSFLRVPLMLYLGKLVEATDWFALMAKQGTKRALAHLGVLGEDTVQDAFATGGHGVWPKLHPRTIANKKGKTAILIETAQMRRSLSSRVVS